MSKRRTAWAISGGLHAAAAGGLWAVGLPAPAPPPVAVDGLAVETSREPEFAVELSFSTSPPRVPAKPTPPVEPPPVEPPVEKTPVEKTPVEPPPVVAESTGRPPVAVPVPAALPTSVTAFVRAFGDRPVRVEEPVRDVFDIHSPPPMRDPAVTQVSAITDVPPPTPQPVSTPAATGTASGRAGAKSVHAVNFAAKSVVYVVDCSGTMGLAGRFERARAAVLASIAGLPDGVKVQVVGYAGRAAPLTADGLAAGADVRTRLAAALAKIEPAGASRHADGLRVALLLHPDAVVILTDADADELRALRPLLAGARPGVGVTVARVADGGVADAVPLK